jgi:thioredoxin 1
MTEYKNQLYVVEVCTDDLPEVAAVAGVVSIPTIQMYFKGQLQDTIVGCVARQVLASSVAKVVEDTLGTDPDGEEEGKKEETLP